jgi:hypothetical protein
MIEKICEVHKEEEKKGTAHRGSSRRDFECVMNR